MAGRENQGEDMSQMELELFFLIAKYLSSGPCKKTAEVLKKELEEHKLLFRRIDWEGGEHFRSYENLVDIYRHVSDDHLLKVARRIGPLLEKDVRSSVRGVSSLLGAGTQSLLRTAKDVDHVRWSGATYAARHHQASLLPPPNLIHTNLNHVLFARQISGGINTDIVRYNKIYSRMVRAFRSLGHLSAVYCVSFDRTGNFIITGADDHLVKIWSTHTGRLLATLRGHSAEITDIAVNYENSLLAAGSCDKMIRVWCLRTLAPRAVLHAHTGIITSLQFCPYIRGDHRYLLSTGGDGCVCFWEWSIKTHKFNPKPIKFIERSRAGAQMLCSSFSPGGVFLATGSSDQVVRVYCFTTSLPEKICELEAHTDRVDSIQYSNHSNRFVSGSKDGCARIWRFERQEWKATVLHASTTLPGSSTPDEENKSNKCKVNMICWNENDQYVIIAVNDCSLKVWDSYTGKLHKVLTGHNDEVFVLESNPVDYRIILSAGHDGFIIVWDIITGTAITKYLNNIEGQGHGAVYDCKWSPDGQSFAATDSHGFTRLFVFGSNERYKVLPEEMFFHTDYRPLIRDSNNYVLDEQTQQPPHLMPPPFLVDIDGNPHPPKLQRLVPGRETCSKEQLVPQIGIAPNGDREVLDEFPEEMFGEDGQQQHPGDEEHPYVDAMIMRLNREQGRAPDPFQSPRQEAPLSPPPIRGPRRSGEVEGVRAAIGNVPVSQQATANDIANWTKRVVVWRLDPAILRHQQENRQHMAEDEIKRFVLERKKKRLLQSGNESSDSGSQIRTRRQRQRSRHGRTVRSNLETSRNRLTTRALYDTEEEDVEEDDEDEEVEVERRLALSRSASEHEEEDDSDQMWHSSSSDSESSEYSDWAADGGINLQPPKRTSSRQPKRRRLSSSEEEEEEEEEEVPSTSQAEPKPKTTPKRKDTRKAKREWQQRQVLKRQDTIQELPDAYKPPDWLTNAIPRKTPYVPQMGDEVIYFQQGHRLYINAVMMHKVYDIHPNKNQPWHKQPKLKDQELMKVVGLKYEIRPPRLVCLKLAFIDAETSRLTGGTFTIKYHDMPDVIDFLVLKQAYDRAVSREWKPGDRFRSMIDDAWWLGAITSQEPFQEEFPHSMFQCFSVHWDNGENERMSPWDLEKIDDEREPTEVGGSVEVTPEEFALVIYSPKKSEWSDCGRSLECDRISHGLESIMELSIAEHFLAPVDLNAFPAYAMVIEYPVDLSTIKSRLEFKYYRRVTSVQYDVRYIENNALKFNEPSSHIVKCAKLVTELCLRFISDQNCYDPMPLYGELAKDADFRIPTRSAASTSRPEYDEDTEVDIDEPSTSSSAPKSKKKKALKMPDKNSWKNECRDLLDNMFECEDSTPFRSAVDPCEYPTYYEIIDHPMDLGTVREQLQCSVYDSPVEFCKDMRLIFVNSRSYNTNKRSRIYSMTLRMSAVFEDQIKDIINRYRSALKFEKTGRLPPSLKKRKKSKPNGVTSTSTPRIQSGSASGTSSFNTSTSSISPGAATSSRPRASAASSNKTPLKRPRLSIPKNNRSQQRRSAKRKRVSSSEEEERGEGEDHDEDDSDSDYEEPRARKRQPARKKPARKPPAKKSTKAISNGHSVRYGTRNSSGRFSKKYEEDSSFGATEDDTEEEQEPVVRPKKGTKVKGASRRAVAPATRSASKRKPASSDTEQEESGEEEAEDDSATQSSSSSSSATEVDGEGEEVAEEEGGEEEEEEGQGEEEDEEEGQGEEEEEEDDDDQTEDQTDDSDSDVGVRRSRRTSTRQNTKATKNSSPKMQSRSVSSERPKRGSSRKVKPKSFQEESSFEEANTSVNTRNRGRRTVRYEEDSDFELASRGQSNSDNSGSEETRGTAYSMSSRGRLRKLTPRARASLLGAYS